MNSINCSVEFLNEFISNFKSNNSFLSNYLNYLLENMVFAKEKFEQFIENIDNKINQFSCLIEEYNEKYISNCNILEGNCGEEFVEKLSKKNEIILAAIKNLEENIEQLLRIKNFITDKKINIDTIDVNIKSNIASITYNNNEISNNLEKTLLLLEKYSKRI